MTDVASQPVAVRVFADVGQAGAAIAAEIAGLIRSRADTGRRCVLGLATGSTPLGVYTELIRLHREAGLSFANVVTFNLDEYWPMSPRAKQSYARFMRERLFDHVDIDPANIHIPDGTITRDASPAYCEAYERAIRREGGMDLQLLGIGRTGHIGFNEPGAAGDSRTRIVRLDSLTRFDAAASFGDISRVPRRAITMGVGTILDARRVRLLAFGERKASIVARALAGEVSPAVPASFLQRHPDAAFVLDTAAATHADLARLTEVSYAV